MKGIFYSGQRVTALLEAQIVFTGFHPFGISLPSWTRRACHYSNFFSRGYQKSTLSRSSATITMTSPPEAQVPKTCKVILADTIAKKLLEEVRTTLTAAQGETQPSLAAFLANDDPAALKYAESSKQTCEEK